MPCFVGYGGKMAAISVVVARILLRLVALLGDTEIAEFVQVVLRGKR